MHAKEYIVGQPATLEDYQAALELAQQHAAACEDKYLRAAAALENARKQAERSANERSTRQLHEVSLRLLDVADNLERALAYATPDNPLTAGVQATLRQLHEVLAREGVAPMPVQPGTPFDPHQHEAVETQPRADLPDMSVAAVRQTGYTVGDRVLRPARVAVVQHTA